MAHDPTHVWPVRYSVEPNYNDKAPKASPEPIRPGVRSSGTSYGYCDVIFLASIVLADDPENPPSVLLLSSEGNKGKPTKEVLKLVRDWIDHYLEHHV